MVLAAVAFLTATASVVAPISVASPAAVAAEPEYGWQGAGDWLGRPCKLHGSKKVTTACVEKRGSDAIIAKPYLTFHDSKGHLHTYRTREPLWRAVRAHGHECWTVGASYCYGQIATSPDRIIFFSTTGISIEFFPTR